MLTYKTKNEIKSVAAYTTNERIFIVKENHYFSLLDPRRHANPVSFALRIDVPLRLHAMCCFLYEDIALLAYTANGKNTRKVRKLEFVCTRGKLYICKNYTPTRWQ